MRHAFLVIVAVSVVATVACKKRRSSAKESPEATVAAFFAAINGKRIPADLDQFISEAKELHTMRFRCKDRRCRRGEFKIRGEEERTEYSVVLLVDYKVFSDDGGIAMRGRKSPFHLQLLGRRWLIKSIGRNLSAKPDARSPAPAGAAPDDAGAPGARDAGTR